MKSPKWIAFVLLTLVLGYFAYDEFSLLQSEREQKKTQGLLYKDLEPDMIESFSLEAGRRVIEAKKETNSWQLLQPIQYSGDNAEIQVMLASVLKSKVEKISAQKEDFKKFGLVDPLGKIVLNTVDRNYEIRIGTEKVFDGRTYIATKDDSVYVASRELRNLITQPVRDFRDKLLFPAGQSIQAIEISDRNKGRFKFELDDSSWTLSKNKNLRLNDDELGQIQSAIKDLKALDFKAEDKQNLAQYSLARPEIELTTLLSDGSEWRVAFSKEVGGRRFAITSDKSVVFELGEAAIKEFKIELDELRDKKYMFDFDPSKVRSIEFKGPQGDYNLVLVGNDWKFKSASGRLVDENLVNDLFDAIQQYRVVHFEAQKFRQDFEKPKAMIQLKDSEGKVLLSLRFGRTYKKQDLEFISIRTNGLDETLGLEKAHWEFIKSRSFEKTDSNQKGNNDSSKESYTD